MTQTSPTTGDEAHAGFARLQGTPKEFATGGRWRSGGPCSHWRGGNAGTARGHSAWGATRRYRCCRAGFGAGGGAQKESPSVDTGSAPFLSGRHLRPVPWGGGMKAYAGRWERGAHLRGGGQSSRGGASTGWGDRTGFMRIVDVLPVVPSHP